MTPEQVTTLRAQLWQNGYRPVAVCNGDSLRSPGKRPVGSGWQERARLDPPEAVTLPSSRNALNTGILCDGLRAVDVDIEDRAIASKVGTLLEQMFGPTVVRNRANSAKFLALYRAVEGEPTKRTLIAETGKVEVLGKGQQFVAFGRHASGAELEWLDGSPEDMPRPELPAITESQVDAFFAACRAIMGEAAVESASGPDARTSSHGLTAELEDIEAAVRVIPPVAPGDWEARNRMAMAIHAATEGTEDGYQILLDCCERLEDFDEAWCEERWANYSKSPPTRAGAGTLFHLARQAVPTWRKPSEPPPSDGSEFAEFAEQLPPEDPDAWKSQLQRGATPKAGGQGAILPTVGNCMIALRHCPAWRGVLGYNEFACSVVYLKQPPFSQPEAPGPAQPDKHEILLLEWFNDQGIPVRNEKQTWKCLESVAHGSAHRFHPVRDYLNGLAWDDTPRLDRWLMDHLGAEDTELNRAFGARFLISAVARVMQPGCQVDHTLNLEGKQGRGKTSAARILFTQEWLQEGLTDIGNKDSKITLRAKWCIEMAELAGVRKADTETLKAFLTTTVDDYREPHGRRNQKFPRQCVFLGTVNPGSKGYLQDETGARRFWPVECFIGWEFGRELYEARLAKERDQIWAEALVRYRNGEKWHLHEKHLQEKQEAAVALRYAEDDLTPVIAAIVADKPHVSCSEVAQHSKLAKLSNPLGKETLGRIGAILRRLGWEKGPIRINRVPTSRFVNPAGNVVPLPPEQDLSALLT